MTTVKDFIEYLQRLPPETIVKVIEGYDCGYSHCTREVDLDLDIYKGNVDFTDFTTNQFVKPGSMIYGKKILVLGEK